MLAIVVLVFGTKRLRNLGGDLGSALRDFRGSMKDAEYNDNTGQAHKRSEEPQVVEQRSATQAHPGPVEEAQRRDNEPAGRD